MRYNPLKSWTVQFLLDHWGPMTLGSALRYRNFVLEETQGRVPRDRLLKLRMWRPLSGDIWLRPHGTDDMAGLREIAYERVYDVVTRRVRACKYVIDLGGNIGLATRFFASRYAECRILVVEPDPENYKVLERNVAELVRAGRCRTVQAGVWGCKARLALGAPPGREACHLEAFVYETHAEDVAVVDTVTIPELIDQSGFPVVDILKIDIEGAEVSLFRGDLAWLQRVRTIAIEFHGDSRERSGFDAVMDRYGFAIDDSNHHTVVAMLRH